MRYAMLALAILALLLAGTRFASPAPGRADVPAINLLPDPAASERLEAPKPREKKRKAKQSGGAAPAPAPAPARAGEDDSDDGDDD